MYEHLLSRVATQLCRRRAMKPQTLRQLTGHLAAHNTSDVASFLLCAAEVLEEYELDILFGPLFTPGLDERAGLADLLYHWRPTDEQVAQLVADVVRTAGQAVVKLPDGTETPLTLHEVMVERYVRLLRLQCAAEAATAAALRESLPAELWPVGVALLCERGMTPHHQRFFAAFVGHIGRRRVVSRGLLEAAADFIARQAALDRASLLAAGEALLRATEGTAAFAAGGHTYWSPDVAQHHQYRGQGRVDPAVIEQRHAELERVAALVEDLRTFDGGPANA
jgi:hypothetical protein